MSIRENIELYGGIDEERYMQTLTDEYGATGHPAQEGAFIVEGIPFYAPREAGDHVSVLSFNDLPLPDVLLEALVKHSDLFPDDLRIRWMQEQDLILEATLGQLRAHAGTA